MKDYIAYVGADVRLDEWSQNDENTRSFPSDVNYVGVFVNWWDTNMIETAWSVWELRGPYPSPYVNPSGLDKIAYFEIIRRK